jgi:hypothetical protein
MRSLISGQDFKKVSGGKAGRGVEYAGPCPVCGGKKGSDRFHVWPDQGEHGTWWCRQCEKGGDLVEFYRFRDGLGYSAACRKAGVEAKKIETPDANGSPTRKQQGKSPFQPSTPDAIPQTWADHAAKFVAYCRLNLTDSKEATTLLADRGISQEAAKEFNLGYNPTDAYRSRESWGLPTVIKDNGKPRKLWLPAGLVIPQFVNGQVARLRIRRNEGEPKYYVIPGSGCELLVTTPAPAMVVVESELDAILLAAIAGDLVGVAAMGTAKAKPTEALHKIMSEAACILVCLDSDEPKWNEKLQKWEAAGQEGSRWWLANYRQAIRVPVIGGKDPGDSYKAGVDIRQWLIAGLPPRFQMLAASIAEKSAKDSIKIEAIHHASSHASSLPQPTETPEQKEPTVYDACASFALPDGATVYVTRDEAAWHHLTMAGEIVFSENELIRLKEATKSMTPDESARAAMQMVKIKRTIPAAYVRAGRQIQGEINA